MKEFNSLIVVMGLLNSCRDGNDLSLRQLDNISDVALLVFRCTWVLKRFQNIEIFPYIFHFINSRVRLIYRLLHKSGYFLGRLAHTQMWYSCKLLGIEVEF